TRILRGPRSRPPTSTRGRACRAEAFAAAAVALGFLARLLSRAGAREDPMSALSRRHFLAASGAAGIASIVASQRAPAFAQGTRLHLLQWSHFVPAADTLFDTQAKEFGKQAGVEIEIERINQNDLQTRATAAIQS